MGSVGVQEYGRVGVEKKRTHDTYAVPSRLGVKENELQKMCGCESQMRPKDNYAILDSSLLSRSDRLA